MGQEMLPYEVKLFAGKTNQESNEIWMPLWMHLWDTAGVMQHLVHEWLPKNIRMNIGMDEDLLTRTACFLALVHDIGQISLAFTGHIMELLPEAAQRLALYTEIECNDQERTFSKHALAGEAILREMGCPKGLASIVGAHHGISQSEENVTAQLEDECYLYNYWSKGQKELWTHCWQKVFDFALLECGFSNPGELPELSIPQEVLLTGLLFMAGWISSDTQYFPQIPTKEIGDESLYPDRIEKGWKTLKPTLPWVVKESSADPEVFKKHFGYFPNEIQKELLETVNTVQTPGIYILETPSCSANTDTALGAAEILAQRFGAGGFFYGLPTQTRADDTFERILIWAQNLSDGTEHSIRLIHDMAKLNEEYLRFEQNSEEIFEDPDPSLREQLITHHWFRGAKKSILSNFVVGTIDQLAMVALKQKYLMMRHLGLAGKVVVIDGIDFCDNYMNTLLDRTLQWLGKYKVPVVMLSNSLPAKRRAELVGAYLNAKSVAVAQRVMRNEYPLLTWTDGEQIHQKKIPQNAEKRNVKIVQLTKKELSYTLRNALRVGGCAGVTVNSVSNAQFIAAQLKHELPDFEVILFHPQFLMSELDYKKKQLVKRIGKNSSPDQRNHLIVVGTSIIQELFDADFDFIVSELCPMHLLIQRIGQLHQNPTHARPKPVEDACCAILDTGTEESDDASTEMYGKWILWRTRNLLPKTLVFPDDIAQLVQETYNWEPDVLPSTAESTALRKAHELIQKKKQNEAKAYMITSPVDHKKMPQREVLDGLMVNTDITRDAIANTVMRHGVAFIDVIVLIKDRDDNIYFLPKNGEDIGARIDTDLAPLPEAAQKIARQRLLLPKDFSQKQNIMQTLKVLEENRAFFPAWQRSRLLQGKLILLLDMQQTAYLAGRELRYDAETGLII